MDLQQLGAQGLGEGLREAQKDVAQVEHHALAAEGLVEQLGHAGPQLVATCTPPTLCRHTVCLFHCLTSS